MQNNKLCPFKDFPHEKVVPDRKLNCELSDYTDLHKLVIFIFILPFKLEGR